MIRKMTGGVDVDHVKILKKCVVGWCHRPWDINDLVRELCEITIAWGGSIWDSISYSSSDTYSNVVKDKYIKALKHVECLMCREQGLTQVQGGNKPCSSSKVSEWVDESMVLESKKGKVGLNWMDNNFLETSSRVDL
ncbi:hypothetical protein V6N12_074362 [Hibiscus sabdariffa]|uniref:Uncharacterized protein n=1 Tax=Hibiscus sabdariffa TaxID=183260 RepID=A0ABR2BKY6_9ROSI